MDIGDNISFSCGNTMKILKLLPLVGIIILAYIIYRVGIFNIYKTFLIANPWYLILSLMLLFLSFVALTFKWHAILKTQGININFLYALKIYLISIFYSNITPARAGSLIRASYLKNKINEPFGKCASGIIIERLMDLFVIFAFSLLSFITFSKYISKWFLPILVSFVFVLLASLFLLKKDINKIFVRLVHKFLIPKSLKEKTRGIYDDFYSNMPSFKKLIYPMFLTILTWFILGSYFFTMMRVYSIKTPFLITMSIFIMGTVISLIPITVGGLGTREATLIFLFSLFSIPAVNVISASLFNIFLGSIIIPLIGLLISMKEPAPEKLI